MRREARIAMRGSLGCLVLLALLLSAGCGSTMRDVAIGRAGVTHLHQEMDAGQFDEIYAEAAPELRNANTHDDFVAFLTSFHQRLGNVKDPTETGFNVNWTNSGTQVLLTYQTKFDKAAVRETFTWRVSGGKALLLGYQITYNVPLTQ